MVILIGGVSCSGKTLMAQRLMEKYKIPYLSIDHIKMGLIRGNKYCDFKATDSDDEIAEKLWPVVKGIIMTNIENDQNIIIEGCYLPPEYNKEFEPEYLKNIITFYLGFTQHYLENHFVTGIVDHRSEIELKELDDYLNLDNFAKMHASLKERCLNTNSNFMEIHEDYETEIRHVYEWVDEQVRRMEWRKR
jgi:putative acetyltransferase